jgi:predicted membrane protein
MSPDTAFIACTTLAGAGWAMLVLFPGKPRIWTIAGVILPCVLAAAYVGALVWNARELSGGFGSLDAVAQLFAHRWALLAGWIHFLAFDLFVGGWIAADAWARRIGRVPMLPLMVLTFLFGPAGLLAYLTLRKALTRS